MVDWRAAAALGSPQPRTARTIISTYYAAFDEPLIERFARKAHRMLRARREVFGRRVDAANLADLIREHGPYAFAIVEQVGARPGQGVSSMFRFG